MKDEGCAEEGLCVGYDRRFLSKEALVWFCEVLAGEGIQVFFVNISGILKEHITSTKRKELGYINGILFSGIFGKGKKRKITPEHLIPEAAAAGHKVCLDSPGREAIFHAHEMVQHSSDALYFQDRYESVLHLIQGKIRQPLVQKDIVKHKHGSHSGCIPCLHKVFTGLPGTNERPCTAVHMGLAIMQSLRLLKKPEDASVTEKDRKTGIPKQHLRYSQCIFIGLFKENL